jgi:hypothetical protein
LGLSYHKTEEWPHHQWNSDIDDTMKHAALTLSVDDDCADKRIVGRWVVDSCNEKECAKICCLWNKIAAASFVKCSDCKIVEYWSHVVYVENLHREGVVCRTVRRLVRA